MAIPFSQQLAAIQSGDLDNELTAKLAKCVAAVSALGGSATLTLKVRVKSTKKGRFELAVVSDTKLPAEAPLTVTLFGSEDGTLYTDNPREGRLFDEPKKLGDVVRASVEKVGAKIVSPVSVVDKASGEVIEVKPHLN